MSRAVGEVAKALRRELVGFDPATLSSGEAATLAEELALTENACALARTLAAKRACDFGAHKEKGFSDPASWIATMTGATTRQAKEALATASALEACSETKDALLEGSVSLAQAHEVARAAGESLGDEHELLEVAKGTDLTGLRDETRERRLSSIAPEDLHRRQHEARRLRHWKDGLGMICFEGALPPESGVPFVSRIERLAARLLRARRHEGGAERFEALGADALVELTSGARSTRREKSTDLVIVCDLFAWRRGHAHPGEPCHLVGGGPIPVDLAKALSADAFLKVALHDGKDVQRITHFGRRYTAELKTALDLGPVPSFSGRACARCKRTLGLQRDHEVPIAATGRTSIHNLQDLCYSCHAEKTERDRQGGLLGTAAKARGPGPPEKRKKRKPRPQPRPGAGAGAPTAARTVPP